MNIALHAPKRTRVRTGNQFTSVMRVLYGYYKFPKLSVEYGNRICGNGKSEKFA